MWHCFLNPYAHPNKKNRLLKLIARSMENKITVYELDTLRAMQQQVAALLDAGEQRFMVAGGDGTIHQFINAVMPLKTIPDIIIAPIPIGSGNDWARSLNTPKSMTRALAGAFGPSTPVDIFRVQTNLKTYWGMNSIGCGFDTQILEEMLKSEPQTFKYARTVLRHLGARQPVNLSINGAPSQHYLLALFGKGKYAGQGLKLLPKANLTDGMLYSTLVEPMPTLHIVSQAFKLISGNFIHHPKVEHEANDLYQLRFTRPTSLQIDGELTPPIKTATIEPLKAPFRVPTYSSFPNLDPGA